MHFRSFFKVNVHNGDIFGGLLSFQFFFVFFFFGGGGGGYRNP